MGMIEFYCEHAGLTVTMVCSKGHAWQAAVPHPRDLASRSFKRSESAVHSCRRCRSGAGVTKLSAKRVHPEVTGALEAAAVLSGDFTRTLEPGHLFYDQDAADWIGAMALAALLYDPSRDEIAVRAKEMESRIKEMQRGYRRSQRKGPA